MPTIITIAAVVVAIIWFAATIRQTARADRAEAALARIERTVAECGSALVAYVEEPTYSLFEAEPTYSLFEAEPTGSRTVLAPVNETAQPIEFKRSVTVEVPNDGFRFKPGHMLDLASATDDELRFIFKMVANPTPWMNPTTGTVGFLELPSDFIAAAGVEIAKRKDRA